MASDAAIVSEAVKSSRPGIRFRRELGIVWLLLLPAMLIFVLYRIAPLIWNVWLSFVDFSLFQPSRFNYGAHYKWMVNDPPFWESLGNTFIYLASAPIGILLALLLALAVNRDIRFRNVYRTILFVSYPLMTVAVGIIWRWMYDEKVGLINYVLRELGVTSAPIAFLESFDLALPAIIVVSVWQVVGFYMIIILAGLQTIPDSLYEAASIDGASKWQQLTRITLPLLRPSLFLAFVIGVMHSITSFDLVYVMTQGGPGHASELLITYIYKAAFLTGEIDYAAALTVVQFILLITITAIGNRAAGGDAGAVKR